MRQIQDTYRAKTLADARAAAIQAIDEQAETGFAFVTISSRREGSDFSITVTYEAADE